MSETCDASVVVCVSVFVVAKVLLYLFYLERLYLLSWAKNPDHAGQPPTFMARFRVLPWVFGIGIFVFGVPCASECFRCARSRILLQLTTAHPC